MQWEVRSLLASAARSYSRHGGRMLASAVAFSSLLSIAPLLYIALGVASVAVGTDAGRASVMEDLGRWIGPEGARTIFALLDRVGEHANSGWAHVFGLVLLVYASTRLFSQLKTTLDHMWDVQPRSKKGLKGKGEHQLRKRGLQLGLVVLVGVLIVAVVILKTIVSAASARLLGDEGSRFVLRVLEWIVSLATSTLMFAALFKVLPDVTLAWRDAWRGALVTAVLFSIGATLIGLYLAHKTLDEFYGPGGSIVLILLWVHYSAQVFFFGAAVTGELAKRRGHPIEPNANGMRVLTELVD